MEPSLFLSMLGFLWVAAITPGPNNLLLTTSGANFGFMRSLWLMIGIMLGMQSILLLVAFGVGSLILVYPSLHLILKILGSLYLLWLAWKVATASSSAARMLSCWKILRNATLVVVVPAPLEPVTAITGCLADMVVVTPC